jgi:WD40 repeat protein/serine/threonine protein kinase
LSIFAGGRRAAPEGFRERIGLLGSFLTGRRASAVLDIETRHPAADELQAYGQGRLAADAAAAIESHIATCASCCQLLADTPADSFVGRLRHAAPAACTTADAAAGTLTEAPAVPPELADHPKFRVLGLVGQGGMGAVYRAEHRRMQRVVALKVINPGLIRNPATVNRFQQEVRAAARLHHPNIVTAYDADQAGGLHFLVMEYIEGRSLADIVQERGPLPIAEACDYVRQAALGLQHAHEQGMVHRDIKPHNLMVVSGGVVSGEWSGTTSDSRLTTHQVKILDFGLARLARSSEVLATDGGPKDTALTSAGAVMGTADYIAPEQAADPRSADIRADIYSLGCTLFHLLTGRPPFEGGTVQDKIAQHATAGLPALQALRPLAPPGLSAVIARMTAKDPAKRYATPAAVAEALAPFSLPSPRLGSWLTGRRRLLVKLAALAVLGLVIAGGIYLRVNTDRGDIVVQTDDNSLELTVEKGGRIIRIRDPKTKESWDVDTKDWLISAADRPDGLAIELPGRGSITLRRRAGGTVTVTTGPRGVPPSDPPKIVPVVEPAELAKRPNAADALKQSDISKDSLAFIGGGDPENVPPELVAVLGDTRFRCPQGAGRPVFSPDGKQLVVPSRDQVLEFDVATGRPLRVLSSHLGSVIKVVFSPNGRALLVLDEEKGMELIDATTGQELVQFPATSFAAARFAVFSPDGKSFVLWSMESPSLELRDTTTGAATEIARPGGGAVADVAFHPSGKALAVTNANAKVSMIFIRPGTWTEPLDATGSRVAFSPDGEWLAIGSTRENPKVEIRDRDRKLVRMLPAACGSLLAFSADSKSLITRLQNQVERWDVSTGERLSTVRLPSYAYAKEGAISPDGHTLAVADGHLVRLFDTATGKSLVSDPGHTRPLGALAFGPDGKLLASAESKAVKIWDLATGKIIRSWDAKQGVNRLAFSPDSKLLATLDSDRIVRLHDLAGSGSSRELKGHSDRVSDLAFSTDGQFLATASDDHTIRLWQVASGKERSTIGHGHGIRALALNADNSLLASVGADGMLIVRDSATGQLHRHEVNGAMGMALAFQADGKTVAFDNLYSSQVWLMDAKTGKVREKFPCPDWSLKGGMYDAFSPGAHLLAVVADDSPLRVWQVGADVRRLRTFQLHPPGRVLASEQPFAFSGDGRYLAAGNPDGTICLLRLAEQGKVPDLQVRAPTAHELAGRPNGADALKHEDVPEVARAYIGGGDAKKTPKELVAVLGETAFRHNLPAREPCFSPDGRYLAVSDGLRVHVFDARTGSLVRTMNGSSVAFTADSRIAVAGWREITFWDVVTGKAIGSTLKYSDDQFGGLITCLAISRDGTYLAAATDEGNVQVWTTENWKSHQRWQATVLSAHQGIRAVQFSPDGRLLATFCEKSARLWEVDTRKALQDWIELNCLAFLPDGERCVAGGNFFASTGAYVFNPKTKATGAKLNGGDVHQVFAPDDKTILLVARANELIRWTPSEKGEPVKVALSGVAADRNGHFALSPDGKTLAVVDQGSSRMVRLFDARTGQPLIADPGHTRSVQAIAWSPDGQKLACADAGGQLILWDAVTRKPGGTLDRTGQQVRQVVFSPNGRWLITLEYNPKAGQSALVVWNAQDLKTVQALELRRGQVVNRIVFSPDATMLAGMNGDHTVSLWRCDEWTEKYILPHSEPLSALAFSPDGAELMTGSSMGRATLWNVKEGKEMARWSPTTPIEPIRYIEYLPNDNGIGLVSTPKDQAGGAPAYYLWDRRSGQVGRMTSWSRFAEGVRVDDVSPTGRLVAYADPDRKLAFWQSSAEDKRRRFLGMSVSVVAFSPDGRYLAAGDETGVVSILRLSERGQLPHLPPFVVDAQELAWRANAADALRHDTMPEIERAYCGGGDPRKAPPELVSVLGDVRFRYPGDYGPIAFDADGKRLALASAGKDIRIYGMAEGRLLREFPSPASFRYRLAFSPDGKILTGAGTGGKFGLIDSNTGKLLWELTDTKLTDVLDFAFSADGEQIALMSGPPNLVETHDAASGKLLQSWKLDSKGLTKLALHPDHQKFATVGFNGEGGVWDFSKGLVGKLGRGAAQVVFSSDGKWLALAREPGPGQSQEVLLIEPVSGLRVGHRLEAAAQDLLAFSRDSKTLITVGHKDDLMIVSRWDVAKGDKLGTRTYPRPKDGPIHYAIDSHGKVLAVIVRGDPVIHIYETEGGEQRGPDPGHLRPPQVLAFSPDGKLLASSDRSTVKLWDLATGKSVRSLNAPDVYRLAFSPDSKALATVGRQRVWVYRVSDGWCTYSSRAYEPAIMGIDFSPDGNLLASGQEDGIVRIHNLTTQKEERLLDQGQPLRVVRFSADGRHLFSGGLLKLRVWETGSGLEKHAWDVVMVPKQIEVLPDSRMLAILALEPTGEVWHVDWMTGEVKDKRAGFPSTRGWSTAVLGPLGHLAAFTDSKAGILRMGEPGTVPLRQRTIQLPAGNREYPASIAFSPDGRYVAVGDPTGLILLLRLSERGVVPVLPQEAR